ncbi:MAG: heavy metal translocating P-type ATPase [Clostridia bacterium]|nr:heavy metal translocating P-type ATPase [Clostridia bacterium]
MKQKFRVSGMSCSACSAAVEKAVRGLSGVLEVSVSLTQGVLLCEYEENKVSEASIIAAVKKAGYGAEIYSRGASASVKEPYTDIRVRLLVSIVLMIALMYVAMGHMLSLPLPSLISKHTSPIGFVTVQLILALPVLYVNRKFFTVGFKALWHRTPNMDSLVAIGSASAFLYGVFALVMIIVGVKGGDHALVERYVSNLYVESAAMILTLVTVGKLLEDRSKKKTTSGIRALSSLSPKTASVLVDGVESIVSATEVKIGDLVLIRPGEKLPVDGVIVEGFSELDTSALTGESMPRSVTVGDEVMTASVNLTGRFVLRATRVGEDTMLSKIIEVVENASASKAPIARLADRVSGIFVPVVMTIALITGIVWMILTKDLDTALNHMISVLVISCPCALGLATPVAVTVAVGRYASHGIFVKKAASLEAMAHIETVVLDKTGTVTVGEPRLVDAVFFGMTEEQALTLAADLESASEHALSRAIVSAAREKGIEPHAPESFEAIPGKGIYAKYQGEDCLCGNLSLMTEYGVDTSDCKDALDSLAAGGKTAVILAKGKKAVALFGIADAIKPTSKAAVEALKQEGVSVSMLTGDRYLTAKALADSEGLMLDEIIADVLPTDKARVIKAKLDEGKAVAMVGDGINDAPALALATVGIAVGSGTDIALDSADLVLLKNDLYDLGYAVKMAKKTLRRIKENLFWAFFYNSIGIPIAAGVLVPFGIALSPMIASAAMSLSSLFVVTNSLRLYRDR